jgi:hypothetical protein
VDPNPLTVADLAIDSGDGGIPPRKTRGVGEQRPDPPGRGLDIDFNAAL